MENNNLKKDEVSFQESFTEEYVRKIVEKVVNDTISPNEMNKNRVSVGLVGDSSVGFVWWLVGFLWWAISGLISPEKIGEANGRG